VTNKQKKFQAFKSYASTAFLLLIIILLLLKLRFYKNPNYPLFSYAVFYYLGGLTQFVYAMLLFGSVMTLRLLHLFNYSDESLYKCLNIVKVLKGLEDKDSIGLKDEKEYESFVQRIKFFKFLIEITLNFSAFLFSFLFIGLAFLVFDTIQSLLFGILNVIFHGLWTNYALVVQLYSFLFYFIFCYYFAIRLKILKV
jgi:hypothetical protein